MTDTTPTNDEKLFSLPSPPTIGGEDQGEGGPLAEIFISPLTAAFPASGFRPPYLYIVAKGPPSEERKRHPAYPNLRKAERDPILPPQGERNIVETYFHSNIVEEFVIIS
jgi:hypothetical protein